MSRYEDDVERSTAAETRTKKSLLIGINYGGSQHELKGCHRDVDNIRDFITIKGYPRHKKQVILRDDANTDPTSYYWPTAVNIYGAMMWLVSEPNTCNFLHFSGHGGQNRNTSRYHPSGFHDTIVPVDFDKAGQMNSRLLHEILVTALQPNSTLFVIFDCCHSGSALELPFIYRSDEDGKVSLIDNVEAGTLLVDEAIHLLEDGSGAHALHNAKQLLAGATSFFHSVMHQEAQETDQYGLGKQSFAPQYQFEGKRNVWMYSGCRDDQTSSDASIQGSSVGAMSWAFLQSMREYGSEQSLLEVLQHTRELLAGRFKQVPQLSVGYEQDLNYPIQF